MNFNWGNLSFSRKGMIFPMFLVGIIMLRKQAPLVQWPGITSPERGAWALHYGAEIIMSQSCPLTTRWFFAWQNR